MSLKIIPEAVSIRASSMVSNKYIVGMGDPEASRCLVSVQQTPRPLSLDDQIVFDVIVSFNSIFNEYGVTFHFIGHVVLKSQVMGSMQSKSSVVPLMGTKAFRI